jgi:hypothetical protein
MQVELNKYQEYLLVAGDGNFLNRYKVKGAELKDAFNHFDRVVYIGKIECFETYIKNPKTGETGWEIVYIEGIREKIEKYYPHFDCFITKGYPCTSANKVVEFYQLEHEDYDFLQTPNEVQRKT